MSTASIFMKGSTEPERRKSKSNAGIQKWGQRFLVCDDKVCELERRAQAEMQAGFATKKEAQEWERMFQLQNSSDLDMSFEAFTELYIRDVKNRLKENTWLTKEHIIRTKILPFFGKLKISEISTK